MNGDIMLSKDFNEFIKSSNKISALSDVRKMRRI